jgi:hypothetical protein
MAGPIDVGSLIQQVFANNESLQPMRAEAGRIKADIANDGNVLIEAMAKQQAAIRAGTLAEQTSKLSQQEAVLLRQRQIGLDLKNPTNDRMAKLAGYLEEESNAHRASVERMQRLGQTGVFPNPIKFILDQMELEGEEKRAAVALGAKNAYMQEMQGIHTLAQENVQTIVQSKLAKTQVELQATLDQQAAEAGAMAAKQRQQNAGLNLSALGSVYNMSADEHSTWFKAAQLQADQANRERDSKQDELRYNILAMQYEDALKDKAGKAALVRSMRDHAIALGGNAADIERAPEERILNNEALKGHFLSTFGSSSIGPYSALNAIESMGNPGNYLAALPTTRWVREKSESIMLPPELLKAPKDKVDKFYDEELLKLAKQEMLGDSDNSLLTRLPAVGELKQVKGINQIKLYKKYAAGAPDTKHFSLKQLIGMAVADSANLADTAKRAQLLNDIVKLAQISVNYTATSYAPDIFGLPKQALSEHGYKINPSELLKLANAGVPEQLSRRFFDLTKPGDVQLLLSLVSKKSPTWNPAISPMYPRSAQEYAMQAGVDAAAGQLREVDPISAGNTKPVNYRTGK